MSEQAIKQILREIGMADREADVYLYLAKSEAQPAATIARGLSMHKAQVYRLVKNLQAKGFLEASLETPAKFSVLPFDQLLDLHVKAKQEELTYLQGHRRENLLEQWQTVLSSDTTAPSEKFLVVEGRERFYSKVLQMDQAAQKKAVHITTVSALLRMERYGHLELLLRAAQRTPRIIRRTIFEVTPANPVSSKRIATYFHPYYEVRHHLVETHRFPRFSLFDDNEVILRLSSSRPETPGSGFWSNSEAIVNTYRILFNELWRNAVDIDERIRELENAT